MSVSEKRIRLSFEGTSNLDTVADQLQRINGLIEKQATLTKNQQAIIRELARQETLQKQAELEKQTADHRAALAQKTQQEKAAYEQGTLQYRAQIEQQVAAARAAAQQQIAEARAAAAQRIELARQETASKKAESDQQTANLRSALNQQDSYYRAQLQEHLLEFKAAKDRETAEFRANLLRQNMLLRSELEEQTGLIRNFRNLIVGAFGIYEIADFTRAIIEAKSKVDIFRTGLQQMIGSKREADEIYARLIEMAKTTPFEVEQLFETTFALKGMGVATKDLLPVLEALGNMAAVVGQDRLPRIAKAFTDVQNKGKLMKQEINQFAENGVPIYDLLAESLGKTRAEVVKLAEDHEITFAQVKKAIMDASDVGGRYYRLMALQAQTLGGQVSNLKDRFFLAKAAIGDYFENTIGGGIKVLSALIDVTIGSESAVRRTVSTVASAASAWVALRVALTLASAQKKILAGDTERLTIAETLLTANTQAMSAAMATATGGIRALGAAIASNPIGALVTVLSLATSAFFAFDAASTQVTETISTQENQLRKEHDTLKSLVEIAMYSKQGTVERTMAIQQLVNKYPEYFGGLNSEIATNGRLYAILKAVNKTYEERIRAAREAYRLDKLQEERNAQLQREIDLFRRIDDLLTAQQKRQFGGDAAKLVQFLQSGSVEAQRLERALNGMFGNIFKGNPIAQARDIITAQRTIEAEIEASNKRIEVMRQDEIKKQIAAENTRHHMVLSRLKKGTADYEQEVKRHRENLDRINGVHHEIEFKTLDDQENKKKRRNWVSAAEIRQIRLEGESTTTEELRKLWEAQFRVEIEQVNKSAKSRQQALQQITGLARAERAIMEGLAEQERKNLSRRLDAAGAYFIQRRAWQQQYDKAFLDGWLDTIRGVKQLETDLWKFQDGVYQKRKLTGKELVEAEQQAQKQIQDARKQTADLTEETLKIEHQARVEAFRMGMSLLSQQEGIIGRLAKITRQAYDDFDILSGKSVQEAQHRVRDAERHLAMLEGMYAKGDKQGQAIIEKQKAQVAESKKQLAEMEGAALNAQIGIAMAIAEMVQSLIDGALKSYAATNKAIADSITRTRDIMMDFYNESIRITSQSLKAELEFFEGSYDERRKIMESFFDRQKQLMESRDALDVQMSYNAQLLEINTSTSERIGKIWSLTNLTPGPIKWAQTIMAWKQHNADIEAATEQRLAREKQLEAERIQWQMERDRELYEEKIKAIDNAFGQFREKTEEEIDLLEQATDEKIALIEKERDSKKDALEAQLDALRDTRDAELEKTREAYDAQLDALREQQRQEQEAIKATFDLKARLLEQSTADEIEKIAILDRARGEALERYRRDEIARLETTRDRILATLTDEAERTAVTNEYAQRIADVHRQVEDARLDKTKGISLATTQLRNEEKAEAERLKQEEKATLERIEKQYQAQFKALTEERELVLKTMRDNYLRQEEELKAQIKALEESSKAEIERIQRELKEEVTRLQNQIKEQEKQATAEKKAANEDYKNAVNAANREIFELNRQMQIALLRAEIATLRAKRWFGNAGRINRAIDDLNEAIATLGGLAYNEPSSPNPGSGSGSGSNGPTYPYNVDNGQPVSSAYTADGKEVVITYNPSGKTITVYDAAGNPMTVAFADGYVPATGERFFKGTEYVQGLGRPDGIDTVPAWLTKGERVFTVEQNRAIGGISNEQAVERLQLFERLQNQFPDLLDAGRWHDMKLHLPEGVSSPGGMPAIDLSELTSEIKELRNEFSRRKLVNINIDKAGFSVVEEGIRSKIEYMQNLLTR